MTEPPAPMPPLCAGCGYDIRLLDAAGACPECGRPLRDARPAGDPLGRRGRRRIAWACRWIVVAAVLVAGSAVIMSFTAARTFGPASKPDPAMMMLANAGIVATMASFLLAALASGILAAVRIRTRGGAVLAFVLSVATGAYVVHAASWSRMLTGAYVAELAALERVVAPVSLFVAPAALAIFLARIAGRMGRRNLLRVAAAAALLITFAGLQEAVIALGIELAWGSPGGVGHLVLIVAAVWVSIVIQRPDPLGADRKAP